MNVNYVKQLVPIDSKSTRIKKKYMLIYPKENGYHMIEEYSFLGNKKCRSSNGQEYIITKPDGTKISLYKATNITFYLNSFGRNVPSSSLIRIFKPNGESELMTTCLEGQDRPELVVNGEPPTLFNIKAIVENKYEDEDNSDKDDSLHKSRFFLPYEEAPYPRKCT